jgi:uncharacterized protein YgiM (DUF1202 family)
MRKVVIVAGIMMVLSILATGVLGQEKKDDQGKQEFPYIGEVKAQKLKVRIKPSDEESSTIVAVIKMGTQVNVYAEQEGFLQISAPEGAWCWVYGELIKKDEKEEGLGVVTGEEAILRSDCRITADEIGKIREGEKVKILDEKYGWYKIQAPEGVRLWVAKKYVKFVKGLKPTPLPPPRPVVDVPGELAKIDEDIKGELVKLESGREMEIDFSRPLSALRTLLGKVKGDPDAEKVVSDRMRRVEDYDKLVKRFKEGIIKTKRELQARLDELLNPKKPVYAFQGYVDTTGALLIDRPGAYKLVTGDGKVICFLRSKDSNIEKLINRYRDKFVGINGDVEEIKSGYWKGYKLAIVKEIGLIAK